MNANEYKVTDNEADSQFEICIGSQVARMTYTVSGNNITFQHTYVPRALEGRGIGSALVRGAFSHAARMQKRVIIVCPFTYGWLAKHPEFNRQTKSAIKDTDGSPG
jgi:predicted GNAT family acetyltransferase